MIHKLKTYSDPVLDRQIEALCQESAPAKRGTTVQRPTKPDCGTVYFDTTLAANGKPIWWTGSIWVDYAGTTI